MRKIEFCLILYVLAGILPFLCPPAQADYIITNSLDSYYNAGLFGVPDQFYWQLGSGETIDLRQYNEAQLKMGGSTDPAYNHLLPVTGYRNLYFDIIACGKGGGDSSENTGVLSIDTNNTIIYGTVTLNGDGTRKDNTVAYIGGDNGLATTTNPYDLRLNGQITSSGSVPVDFVFSGRFNTTLKLGNTNPDAMNNYVGNTIIGAPDVLDSYTAFYGLGWGFNDSFNSGGTLQLWADEQIPDVKNNGTACAGILIMNAFGDSGQARFDLNGFNETINGLANNFVVSYGLDPYVPGSGYFVEGYNAGHYSQPVPDTYTDFGPNVARIYNSNSSGNGLTSTLTIGAGDTSSTFSGNIGAGGTNLNITKIGSGTLTLTGELTYSGLTTVSGGILDIQATGDHWGNGGGFRIENGAELILNKQGTGNQIYTDHGIDILTFGQGGGKVTINPNTNFYSYQPVITTEAGTAGNVNYSVINGGDGWSNGGINLDNRESTFNIGEYSELRVNTRLTNSNENLYKNGAGTLILAGRHLTYGRIIINDGTLEVQNWFEDGKGFDINNGARLVFTSGRIRANVAQNIVKFGAGGGTLELNNNSSDHLMFDYGHWSTPGFHSISTTAGADESHVNKSYIIGTGWMNFNNRGLIFDVAEYSELTCSVILGNDNQGIIFNGLGTFNLVSNFDTDPAKVFNLTSDIARLNIKDDGAKHVTGSLTINDGSRFSPGGNSADPFGTATIDGAFTVNSGGKLVLELGAANHDLLILNDVYSFADSSSILLDLLVSPDEIVGYELIAGTDAGTLNTVKGWLAGIYTELDFSVQSWNVPNYSALFVSYNGNEGPGGDDVPEPATWVMMLLGAGGLAAWRRKRQ